MEQLLKSEAETRALGADWVQGLGTKAVVRLHGSLGAGKTTFVRGMLEGLGWKGAVTSPTFSLVQEYATTPPLVHSDLYRLVTADEVWELELDRFLEAEVGIFAVEWSERAESFWPEDTWQVWLESAGPEGAWRQVRIEGGSI